MKGGVLGNGVRVGFAVTSPATYTPVGQVLDLTAPQLTADEVDSTVHGTSKWKRNMPGMVDVSEMSATLLADLDEVTSPDQDKLFLYSQTQQTLVWRYEVPTDRTQTKFTAFEFQGWVKGWLPAFPIADKQTLVVTVRFDGDYFVKFPAGTSTIPLPTLAEYELPSHEVLGGRRAA